MKALEDIKVLDFTHVQSGPTCTQLLAWFGADVIKVERPGVGDATRKQLVDVPGADSLYFTMLNHNKRSIELNSKNEMKPLLELPHNNEPYNTNRQNLPEVYAQTGSIDITRPETIKKYNSMTGKKIYPYIIDQRYFVDIDNIESLEIASIRMKRLNCIKFNQ